MTISWASTRELRIFLLGPALAVAAITALYRLHPWPVCTPMQALNFQWPVALGYLALGVVGVALSSRVGVPSAPQREERTTWRHLVLLAALPGSAVATFDLSLNLWPPFLERAVNGAHAVGMTWFNVAFPASIPHYIHAAILSECVFRLGPIVILTWLISSLVLKGRFQATVFWSVAALTALIEPIEQAVLSHGMSVAHASPVDAAFAIYGVVFQLFEAWLMRRLGWPAPIFYRLGYYLIAHVAGGYLFPPQSIFYPGPH